MAETYLFLNYNCILAYEISFSDRWGDILRVLAKNLTLCRIYRSNSHHGKFTALNKLVSIVLRLTNQSRETIRCQGYFLKLLWGRG